MHPVLRRAQTRPPSVDLVRQAGRSCPEASVRANWLLQKELV